MRLFRFCLGSRGSTRLYRSYRRGFVYTYALQLSPVANHRYRLTAASWTPVLFLPALRCKPLRRTLL